jgi:hypothetical protein
LTASLDADAFPLGRHLVNEVLRKGVAVHQEKPMTRPRPSKAFVNVVLCWKCKGSLSICSDDVNDVLDNIPENCPGCGASWDNSRRMLYGSDDAPTN